MAALPVKPGRYELFNPADGTRRPIDEAMAVGLEPYAYSFYRPFPARVLRLRDLWKFSLPDVRQDVRALVAVGIAATLLGLVVPLLTGHMFNTVIPNANLGQLWELFVVLVVASLAGQRLTADGGLRPGAPVAAFVFQRLLGGRSSPAHRGRQCRAPGPRRGDDDRDSRRAGLYGQSRRALLLQR